MLKCMCKWLRESERERKKEREREKDRKRGVRLSSVVSHGSRFFIRLSPKTLSISFV